MVNRYPWSCPRVQTSGGYQSTLSTPELCSYVTERKSGELLGPDGILAGDSGRHGPWLLQQPDASLFLSLTVHCTVLDG